MAVIVRFFSLSLSDFCESFCARICSTTSSMTSQRRLEFNLASKDHGRKRAQFANRLIVERCIDLNHSHCFTAPLVPAEMKATDVNTPITQNCADPADDPGHVPIPHHEHVAMRNRFNVKSVDLSDAAFTSTASRFENSTGHRLLAGITEHAGT